jgi:hypothetical protein
MATAKFSIGIVNITGYLRVVAREVNNPTSEVADIVFAPPHPTTRNIQIDNLNPVMHFFDFYESVDGIVLGTLLATYSVDVGKIYQASFTIYDFIVDRGQPNDPTVGETAYHNTAMAGLLDANVVVTQRGVGPRNYEDEIELLDAGGFQFKSPSTETFVHDDRWYIMVANLVTQTATVVARTIYTDIMEFNSDVVISGTHYNKLLEANGATTNILSIFFPALSTIPDDTVFGVNTHFGSQRYVAIIMTGTDRIRFMGAAKDKTWLARGEDIMFIKKGSVLKVEHYNGDYRRVGEIVKGDLAPLNGIAETGGWKNIADYPRFFYEFVNHIPLGQLAAKSDIDSNDLVEITKFSIDSIGGKFWVPDSGGYFDRNVDPNGDVDTRRSGGNRYTGNWQSMMVQDHLHSTGIKLNSQDYVDGGASPNNIGTSAPGALINTGSPVTPLGFALTGEETAPANRAVNSWRVI